MKRRSLRSQRAIDLIGRHMQNAESLPFFASERFMILTARSQQSKRPIDIGPQKRLRSQNRSVDMALSSEVNNCSRPVLSQQPHHEFHVADIAMNEGICRIFRDRSQ